MAPSTFASAAAGGNPNASARQDGPNEWSRRTNGTSQTFRRPSLATTFSNNAVPTTQRDASLDAQPARYVPPHRNGTVADTRYSKEQLLGLVRSQFDSGNMQRGSLVGGPDSLSWGASEHANGAGDGSNGWGRKDGHAASPGQSDALWESERQAVPRGLVDLTEVEKEIFDSSVNSPIKPMNTTNREGQTPLRKISISHNTNVSGPPTATRAPGRRREASESYPFPTNPLAPPKLGSENRTASPPPALRRRATDYKNTADHETGTNNHSLTADEDEEKDNTAAFGGIAPVSAGLNDPSTPWGPVQPSPGFAPMGAFASFGASSAIGEKRPGIAGGRAESRFKGLMARDSTDEIGRTLKEKPSLSSFPRQPDASTWRSGWPETGVRKSMELDGTVEDSGPSQFKGLQGLGTPQRPDRHDEYGVAAFGMTPDAGWKGTPQDRHHNVNTTMSPTNTNPYQSPHQDQGNGNDAGADSTDLHNAPLSGLGGLVDDDLVGNSGGFGAFPSFNQAPGDRSQTSSVGPQRAFPTLGGLGTLSGLGGSSAWGGLATSNAMPSRGLHSGFGDPGVAGLGDIHSPGLAGLGSSSFFGSGQSAAPGSGRGVSRMGPLFQQQSNLETPRNESKRLDLDDDPNIPSKLPGNDDHDQYSSEHQQTGTGAPPQSDNTQQPQLAEGSGVNQPPAAQQRTMVMPDRMRWIYRDPQGNTQGPWSGLEMHDWYKAGFFSPELLVKKYEDAEYEPLVQLIRRIGNSREPFLVPQIGIPHGPPQSNWGSGPLPAGTGQPPFAASFPSFGTTLTADQQNALERRKQEEQYLMARQKEHLAQQQMAQRMQGQGQHGNLMPHQLQHHASVQSLIGQQNIGGIGASAQGFQGAGIPPQAQPHNFPDQSYNQQRGFGAVGGGPLAGGASSGLGAVREEGSYPAVGNAGVDQAAAGQQAQQQFAQDGHRQQVDQMFDDRARLQQEQAQFDQEQEGGAEASFHNDRLQQFQQFQQDLGEGHQQNQTEQSARLESLQREVFEAQRVSAAQAHQTPTKASKSLTEQVQQAVSAQQSPANSPWAKVDPTLPQPFPPAPSQSPLPAPAAQRNRSHVADALHAESDSRSETPSVETPSASIAPWAKEPAEAPKGPSLKEIQEAEARKAAKAEAIAAEARKIALEKELALAQLQAAAAAASGSNAGLPSTSTWAAAPSASPTISSGQGPAWAKTVKTPTAPSAKSMAQIQKEEEARKKRLAAAALAAQQAAAPLTGVAAQIAGKRYAELASKTTAPGAAPASPSAQQPTGAWTTVGASGKVKPVVATLPVRTVSTSTPPVAAAAAAKKPAIARAPTMSNVSTVNAQEEFKRWAVNELRGDLNKGVNPEDFIANLLAFPPEIDILTEAVHSVSTTIDSRHYAEEFLRKRKLADKGVFEAPAAKGSVGSPAHHSLGASGAGGAAPNANGGGWSEVAKRSGGTKDAGGAGAVGGGLKEAELAGQFKVVAAKKKAGKR